MKINKLNYIFSSSHPIFNTDNYSWKIQMLVNLYLNLTTRKQHTRLKGIFIPLIF